MDRVNLYRRVRPMVPPRYHSMKSRGSGDLFPFALSTHASAARASLLGAWKEVTLPLQHAGAPGLLQPLLKRPSVDGFLGPALAIFGAVDLAVKQELAQGSQPQLVVLHRGLRNALD